MKIIFYSYSGVHSAVLSGAVYLGRLSLQGADLNKFKGMPLYGKRDNQEKIKYLGMDNKGNKVYSLGVQGELELIPKAILDFLKIADISQDDLIMINTYSTLSIVSKLGERLAEKGFSLLGNYFFFQGMKKDFPILFNEAERKLGDSRS